MPDPDDRPFFPPDIVVKIKALACELPCESGLPLSRYSNSEIAAEAIRRGIVAEISGATIWRWLDQDAIRPWQFRSWIFPRDPRFEEKAGPVLDLYQGRWRGEPLHPDDLVICADEKPSIQARQRKHVPRGPRPRQAMRVEHEYERRGALCYFAALHLPIHASWLNQIEIYFSIVQRKVLTPNDFPDLQTLEAQLFKFQDRYQRMAQPFEWRFTRADLAHLLSRLNAGDTLQLSA